jgi:alpha-glucosidase
MALSAAQANTVSVSSPDGTVRAVLSDDAGALRYRVSVDGRAVLDPSPLGIRVNGVELGEAAALGAVQRQRTDTRYRFFGAKAEAVDRANIATIALRAHGIMFSADLHVANDGVAVRLRLPARAGQRVEADRSGWKLAAADPRVWTTSLLPDYENLYQATTLRSMADGLHGLPLTAKIDKFWVTISEAAVVDYGDLAITRGADGLLAGSLYADPQGWQTDAAVVQPWRVTIVARALTGLVNSTLVQNLNPPPSPALAGADWVRPGRSTWQWLAIGDPLESDQHQWVDWTKKLGFDYYLIDDGWAKWKQPWETLAETARYARSKGIGVWAWIHSDMVSEPAPRRALLRRLAKSGIVGVKVDFPKPAGHGWSNWYVDTARDAAAERLMVDFHGAAKPTGTERTWPNILTREAVRGHEWHITRYGRVLPPAHDTILPFTRYVVGPGDYTPTVFEPKELQGNSWAHELAQMVLFTSPYLSTGGHPRTYLENPAVDVLKAISPIWDETIVLPGSEPGTLAGFARRRGKEWFVAVINGAQARSMTIGLGFLGRGSWHLTALADDPARADRFVRTERVTASTGTIAAALRPGGGFVGWLRAPGR